MVNDGVREVNTGQNMKDHTDHYQEFERQCESLKDF